MIDHKDFLQNLTNSKWVRLALSLFLAFVLALTLFLFPLSLNGTGLISNDAFTMPMSFNVEIVRADGGVTLTKQVTPDPVNHGQQLTYTFRFVNQSGGPLGTVADTFFIVDQIPAGTHGPINVSNSDDNGWLDITIPGNNEVRWLWLVALNGPIPNGYDTVVTYTVWADEPLPDEDVIINTAGGYLVYQIFSDASTSTLDLGDEDVTTTVYAPKWDISKSALAQVEPGDYLTYTITAQNTGHFETEGVYTITDVIPSPYISGYITSDPPAVQSGDLLTWVFSDTLAVNAARVVTYVVQVQQPLTDGVSIINSGYAVTGGNVYTGDTGDPVTTLVRGIPDLTISKSSSPASEVEAGDLLTYTITITNLPGAKSPALGVTISDTLPAETVYQNATLLGGVAGTISQSNNLVQGLLTDAIAVGDSVQMRVVVRVNSPLPNGMIITNTHAVSAVNALAWVTGTPLPTVISSSSRIDGISKVVEPTLVLPQDTVTYTITITNTGNEDAAGVQVTDTLPAGFVPQVHTFNNVAVPGRNINAVPGSQTLVFTATVPLVPGVYSNTLITVTNGAEVDTLPESAPVTVRAPVLNLVKADYTDPVEAGEVLTYTLTYSNSGDAVAYNARLTDTFAANAPFAAATPAPSPACAPGSIQCSWDLGDLPPNGVEQTIVVTVNVASPLDDGSLLTNTAIVATAGHSTQVTETTTVSSSARLHIVKTGSNGANPVQPGSLITYTIAYSNSGNAVARNVRITDTIDGNTIYVGASPAPTTLSDPDYIWVIGNLVPSATQWITLTVQVTDSLAHGAVLTNNVVIRSDTGVEATDSATATVLSDPVLHLSKIAGASTIEAGETLTYTIWYSNTGNGPATGVIITDTLPAGLSLQNATPFPDSGSDPTYVWDIGDVPAGGPYSITVRVLAGNIITDMLQLTNVVTMTSVETDTLYASADVTVHAVDLNVSKTVEQSTVKANEFITYTITVANAGHGAADNILITDTLPISVVQSTVISSASAGVNFNSFTGPNAYVWEASTLAGLSGFTISVSGRLATDPWPAAGWVITNTAQAYANQDELDFSNNSSDRLATGRPGDPYTITLTAVPVITQVGNTIAVTATVTDQWGNPAFNGEPVNFVTSTGLNMTPATLDGRAGINISSLTPAVVAITATATTSGITATTTVTFTVGAPHHFTFNPIGTQIAGVPFVITTTVEDQLNNPVLTYTTSASLSDSTGTMQPTATGTGWSNGVITRLVTITRAWTGDVITATDGTITGTSNLFNVLPGPPTTAVMTTTSPVSVCGSSLVSATVYDDYGNSVPVNTPVNFSYSSSGPVISLSPNPRYTNSSGFVTTTLTSILGTPGIVTMAMQWTTEAITIIGNNTIDFSLPRAPTTLTLNVSPNPISTGGQTAQITATVTTCPVGTLLSGQPVVFTVSDPTLAFLFTDPFTMTTDTNGQALATITSNSIPQAGTVTITATAGGLQTSTQLNVQLASAPVLTITKTANPAANSTVYPGQTIDYTINVANNGTAAANGLVITDTLDDDVAFVSGALPGGGGPYVDGSGNVTFSLTSLANGSTATATLRVTVSDVASGTLIDNQAWVYSTETGQVGPTALVSHPVITRTGGQIFLPVIMKNPRPDLIATFTINPANPSSSDTVVVTVLVTNTGSVATGTGFWLDFYVDPVWPPTEANQRWDELSDEGIAWIVPALAPGQSVRLTSDGSGGGIAPSAPHTDWSGSLSGGSHNLYVYADSYSSNGSPNGGILENIETNNSDYLAVDVSGSIINLSDQSAPVDIPPRWDP